MSNPGTSTDLRRSGISVVNLFEKKIFAIVVLTASDLWQEYKIISKNDACAYSRFEEGSSLMVKDGGIFREGTIVKISDDELFLQKNFEEFVSIHQNWIKNRNTHIWIGTKGTNIPTAVYNVIDWSHYVSATRGLLSALFSMKELATRTLLGKPCRTDPNNDRNVVDKLNVNITSDIIEFITWKYHVTEDMVKGVITGNYLNERRLREKRHGETEEENTGSSRKRFKL